MTKLSIAVKLMTSSCLAALLASACGGKSFVDDGGNAGGTSSQGGSASHAGTSSSAGKSSAGASSGGTGTAGTTGYAGEGCIAPPVTGNCDAYFEAWYHDASTGICRPFVYGGCGGNANRYGSLEECQRACPPQKQDYDLCQVPTDCVVSGTGCCGVCDAPTIGKHDLIAYNRQYPGNPGCAGVLERPAPGADAPAPIACAPCLPSPDGTLGFFVPDCVKGQCVVTDLRESGVTACKSDQDCKLRMGTRCCEGCDPTYLFAVRNDGSFEELVCGDLPSACDGCAATPALATAVCGKTGHCEVQKLF